MQMSCLCTSTFDEAVQENLGSLCRVVMHFPCSSLFIKNYPEEDIGVLLVGDGSYSVK